MRAKVVAFTALFVVMLGIAVPVSAKSFIQADDTGGAVTVAKTETIDGSAFLAGNSLASDATIDGDVFCVGNDISVRGTVASDVLCGGNNVRIEGRIKGDIRIFANSVYIDGMVDGNATIAANRVEISPDATIAGDANITAGSVEQRGKIGRDTIIAAGQITIDGSIGRDADLTARHLRFGGDASIAGSLEYSTDDEISIEADVVGGDTTYTVLERSTRNSSVGEYLQALFFGLLTLVVLTLAVQFFARNYVDTTVHKTFASVGIALLAGAMASLIGLFVVIFLFATIVAWPVALGIMFLYGLGSVLAMPLVSRLVGMWIVPASRPLMQALVGATTLGVVAFIPFAGWVVVAVAYLAGFGMFIVSLQKLFVRPHADTNAPVARSSSAAKQTQANHSSSPKKGKKS